MNLETFAIVASRTMYGVSYLWLLMFLFLGVVWLVLRRREPGRVVKAIVSGIDRINTVAASLLVLSPWVAMIWLLLALN